MSHREFMRYTERLKRDMDVLKASHEIVDLSYKIERLKDELDEQTDLYSAFLNTRRTIAGWIRDCDALPLASREYLYNKCFDFLPSEDPQQLALEIQDFALEVTERAESRGVPNVRRIICSLMELADTVIHLK